MSIAGEKTYDLQKRDELQNKWSADKDSQLQHTDFENMPKIPSVPANNLRRLEPNDP